MGIAIVIIMGMVSCLVGLLMGYYFDSESSGSESKRVCNTSRNSIKASKLIGEFLKCREAGSLLLDWLVTHGAENLRTMF